MQGGKFSWVATVGETEPESRGGGERGRMQDPILISHAYSIPNRSDSWLVKETVRSA